MQGGRASGELGNIIKEKNVSIQVKKAVANTVQGSLILPSLTHRSNDVDAD